MYIVTKGFDWWGRIRVVKH